MKYVRTDTHIYLIQKDISYGRNRIYKIYNHSFSIIGNDFKVADTIEELCDEFVMTHYFKETNYTKCEALKEDKDLMIEAVRLKKIHNKDKDLKNEFNIYGAIWTDKGLIYVAKMNEKGELELI